MDIRLPEIPEPTEVEIELTNKCNARCVACPRGAMTADKGFMSDHTFHAILEKYARQREHLAINRALGRPDYPVITFAGMGEPLLHPRAARLIAEAAAYGFQSILFTNASQMTAALAEEIASSGVRAVYVSFWGIMKDEYERSMGLNYEQTLGRVERLCASCRRREIPVTVIWVANEHIKSSPEEIDRFWGERGVAVDHDNWPWNRAGYLDGSFPVRAAVDFGKEIWCSQLFFTDTLCWNGQAVLCSCDYYERRHVLADIHAQGPADISAAKLAILRRREEIALCSSCLKPDRNYSFGTAPWDAILPEGERRKYSY